MPGFYSEEQQNLIDRQLSESYDAGYSAGLAKGERMSEDSLYYTSMLDRIRHIVIAGEYILDNDDPSDKGIKHMDMVEIYNIVKEALGL